MEIRLDLASQESFSGFVDLYDADRAAPPEAPGPLLVWDCGADRAGDDLRRPSFSRPMIDTPNIHRLNVDKCRYLLPVFL